MYRALYDFDSHDEKLLGFRAGDLFTLITITDKNWCYVHDARGRMGHVPITYVTEDVGCAPVEVVASIDEAIRSVHQEATDLGRYTEGLTQRLKKLQRHRRTTLEEYRKLGIPVGAPRRPAPQPPGDQPLQPHPEPLQPHPEPLQPHREPLQPQAEPTQQPQPQAQQPHIDEADSQHHHQAPSSQPLPNNSCENIQKACSEDQPVSPRRRHKKHQAPPPPPHRASSAGVSGSPCDGPVAAANNEADWDPQKRASISGTPSSPPPADQLPPRAHSVDQPGGAPSEQPQSQPPPEPEPQQQVACMATTATTTSSRNSTHQHNHKQSSHAMPTPSPPRTTTTATTAPIALVGSSGGAAVTKVLCSRCQNEVRQLTSGHSRGNVLDRKLEEGPAGPTTPHVALTHGTAASKRHETLNWAATVNGLIDTVRHNSRLSYAESRGTVAQALAYVKERVPSCHVEMSEMLDALHSVSEEDVESSRDMTQLRRVLHDLKCCHDDTQQRSWPVHEDEAHIRQLVLDLASILTDANPKLCRKLLVQDNYEVVYWLTTFYQMETRVSIRLELLKVFATLCELDHHCITQLVSSILPVELARDMMNKTDDKQKLVYSAMVLTMIFSTGETPPIKHYDHLNKKFVHFLLKNIEAPPAWDTEDQVADLFVKLLLAFNLHFQIPSESFVLKALKERDQAKLFTEKILMLFNREEDPVYMFEHYAHPAHSVIKLLEDMYSNEATAALFYHNDVLVMIDITVREITNLSPGDKLRTEYLSFAYQLIKHCEYERHKHRRLELQKCFTRIEHEEEKEAEADRYIVRQILQEFCHFFKDELVVAVI